MLECFYAHQSLKTLSFTEVTSLYDKAIEEVSWLNFRD